MSKGLPGNTTPSELMRVDKETKRYIFDVSRKISVIEEKSISAIETARRMASLAKRNEDLLLNDALEKRNLRRISG